MEDPTRKSSSAVSTDYIYLYTVEYFFHCTSTPSYYPSHTDVSLSKIMAMGQQREFEHLTYGLSEPLVDGKMIHETTTAWIVGRESGHVRQVVWNCWTSSRSASRITLFSFSARVPENHGVVEGRSGVRGTKTPAHTLRLSYTVRGYTLRRVYI